MMVHYSFTAVTAFAALLPTLTHSYVIEKLQPSEEVAIQRGPQIFNAVHNAMRQWGSSLHHNGMSFFLATVPEGVVLHHGNNRPESPTDPDWLAYEIEHAENFARGGRRGPGGPPGGGPPDKNHPPKAGSRQALHNGKGQKPIIDTDKEEPEDGGHGYLHVYRASRQLHYLYVDGMSGGKTSLGSLDSQDYLLRGTNSSNEDQPDPDKKPEGPHRGGPMDEHQRAVDLCKLCKQWDLQGVIRMEAGFEIIQCDFSDGLEQIQALQRSDSGNGKMHEEGLRGFEFVRGLSERYQGIGSGRTIIDYSSMVSAFFFPINLTNPDPERQDLPRLVSTPDVELDAIRSYLSGTIEQRRGDKFRTIDWQDATDLIVGRYADRVQFLAEKVDDVDTIADEISFLLDVYIDYSDADRGLNFSAAKDRCTNYYLRSISPVTEADHLIHAALKTVTSQICSSLFEVRELVVSNSESDHNLNQSVKILKDLMGYLQWTRFKRCPPCAVNEVCAIPMWPFGRTDDYNNPHCRNASDINGGDNYWGRPGPGGGPGHGPGGRPGDGNRGPPPF